MDIDTAVKIVLSLLMHFEGLYLRPYLCPAGIPTIGLGSTFYEDGVRVTLADPPITRERAFQLATWHIKRSFLPDVMRLCAIDNPQRLAAIVDFAYNLGTGALKASTLRRRINEGRWDDVPTELRKWVKGGGRVLRGLVLRREAEVALV